MAREGFKEIYRKSALYRATGVVLAGLVPENSVQLTLFDNPTRIEKLSRLYSAIDLLSGMFGKHTVQHVSSLPTMLQRQHEGDRGDVPKRKTELFKGENRRQRIGAPLLDMKV